MLRRMALTLWPRNVETAGVKSWLRELVCYPEQSEIVTVTGLGWLPALSLTSALSLLVVAFGISGARTEAAWHEIIFWIGLGTLYVPIAVRLLFPGLSRQEYMGLVLCLGFGLYLVKVIHSPLHFTFYDELLHWRTADDIIKYKHLFEENPLLPVSPLYPGLEIATTALANLTGLNIFVAGWILVGTSRLVFVSMYFLFSEEVGRSTHLAAIATLIYLCNPNFLYFDAQFAYESLAISFAMLGLFALKRRLRLWLNGSPGLTMVALLGLGGAIITHHVTSYFLLGFLALWAATYLLQHWGEPDQPALNWTLILVVVAVFSWTVYVAIITVDYLVPVLSGTVNDLLKVIMREESGRKLFGGHELVPVPIWERISVYISTLLLFFGMCWGLFVIGLYHLGVKWETILERHWHWGILRALMPKFRVLIVKFFAFIPRFRIPKAAVRVLRLKLRFLTSVWNRRQTKATYLVLSLGALLFPATQAFRFTERGSEISGRFTAFMFVALSFVIAVGINRLHLHNQSAFKRCLFILGFLTPIFMGGVITGFPRWARLPGPYLASADSRSVEIQGVEAARRVREILGSNNSFGADRINGLLMTSYGAQAVVTGAYNNVNVPGVFLASELIPYEEEYEICEGEIRYLVVDYRFTKHLPALGFYYEDEETKDGHATALDPAVLAKFDHEDYLSRVFDSGDIAIYRVDTLPCTP